MTQNAFVVRKGGMKGEGQEVRGGGRARGKEWRKKAERGKRGEGGGRRRGRRRRGGRRRGREGKEWVSNAPINQRQNAICSSNDAETLSFVVVEDPRIQTETT